MCTQISMDFWENCQDCTVASDRGYCLQTAHLQSRRYSRFARNSASLPNCRVGKDCNLIFSNPYVTLTLDSLPSSVYTMCKSQILCSKPLLMAREFWGGWYSYVLTDAVTQSPIFFYKLVCKDVFLDFFSTEGALLWWRTSASHKRGS